MDEHSKEKDHNGVMKDSNQIAEMKGHLTAGAFDCFSIIGEQSVFRSRPPRQVHWSVVWSDIMMTMFIMFAVLYIYQAASRDFHYGNSGKERSGKTTEGKPKTAAGEGKDGSDETSEWKMEMMNDIEQPMETARLKTLKEIERIKLMEDKAVRIVLPADLLFDTGKADLKPQAEKSLREVAGTILESDDTINVVGHTDDVPIHSDQFATNWELSAIRACTVARFLIERAQVPAERFYISGHSYFQPVKPNTNLANRAENRRVEIILTKKKPAGVQPGN